MKYITIEELERRKEILQDKLKKAQEESKNSLTKDFAEQVAQSHLFEVEYLIDYIKMKFEQDTKADWCCNCKKFGKCKVRENTLVWGLGHCGLFEQKESK